MTKVKVGIIGLGEMGGAIASRLHSGRFFVIGYDIQAIDAEYEIAKNIEEMKDCSAIFVCVRPADVESVLNKVKREILNLPLIISVAAGVRIEKISKIVGDRVVRVMPNMGAEIGRSMSIYCKDREVEQKDIELLENMLFEIGEYIATDERKLDMITAVSGSGPAYFFYLSAVMQKYLESEGIESAVARKIVSNTFFGSAEVVRDRDFEYLLRKICTPGGVTQTAIEHFEKEKMGDIVRDGIKQARDRNREMGD